MSDLAAAKAQLAFAELAGGLRFNTKRFRDDARLFSPVSFNPAAVLARDLVDPSCVRPPAIAHGSTMPSF